MMQWIKPGTRIDFVGNRQLYYLITACLIIGSLALIAIRGLNYGIDFAGGYEMQLHFKQAVTVDKIQNALKDIQGLSVQNFGEENGTEYVLRLERKSGVDVKQVEAVRQALVAQLGSDANAGVREFLYAAETPERIKLTLAKDLGQEALTQIFSAQKLTVHSLDKSPRPDLAEYQIVLKTVAHDIEARLKAALSLPADESIASRVEYVGPQVGEQLRNQGILAVLYSLLFMLVYIAFRFDFFFGPGAIVCLFHDTIVTVGMFALTGKEFNLQTIAALLTIVGYSMNDTIVVFDRIRENNIKLKGQKLEDIVNFSLNETLSRTLLTTFVTLLVVIAMMFLGGGVLADFGFALFIGFIVGTYSSIAVASPIYIYLYNKFNTPVSHAALKHTKKTA